MPDLTPGQIAQPLQRPGDTPTRTPGQVCYDGFWRTTSPDFRDDWPTLHPSTQARWEAAAQAVLARCTPQETP